MSASAIMGQCKRKPYDIIFKNLAGCIEQCPFCHEQCDHTNENHTPYTKHTVAMHRLNCLGGWRCSSSGKMILDICTSLVGSDRSFHPCYNSQRTCPYKRYQEEYPEWKIPDDKSFRVSSYWKWLVGNYSTDIARVFHMKVTEIPYEFLCIRWTDVKKDLEDLYCV